MRHASVQSCQEESEFRFATIIITIFPVNLQAVSYAYATGKLHSAY